MRDVENLGSAEGLGVGLE